MTADERAIRELIATWMSASQAGDLTTLLELMTDDVVFMAPGGEPFGKEAFAAAGAAMSGASMEASCEIVEVNALGEWAYTRTHIAVTMTSASGVAQRRSGYTLSILRRGVDGRWRITRDANLLTLEAEPG